MQKKKRTPEQRIYMGCLLLLPCIILLAVLYHYGYFIPTKILPPCMFHALTGFSCPGCGCTRAISALLHGNIWLSLRLNPCMLYCTILYLAFLLSHTAAYFYGWITKKLPSLCREGSPFHIISRIRGMKCTPVYLYILVYLFLGFGVLRFLFELWSRLH